MSGKATGSVKSLYKNSDGGYDVSVDIKTDGPSLSTQISTPLDDPKQAIEAVRKMLFDLGTGMAKAFENAGSLK